MYPFGRYFLSVCSGLGTVPHVTDIAADMIEAYILKKGDSTQIMPCSEKYCKK